MQTDWTDDDETVIDKTALVTHFKAGTLSDAELRFLTGRLTGYVRRNYSALFGEADLIASQAIFHAFRQIEGLRDPSSFYGWIIVIVTRLSVRRCKELKRLPTQSRDAATVQTNTESPEEVEAIWEQDGFDDNKQLRRMILKDAFLSLTEEQQHVLFCRFFGGYSSKEVSVMIGKSDEATRQVEHRACRKMRDYLVINGYADLFVSVNEARELQIKARPTIRITSLVAAT